MFERTIFILAHEIGCIDFSSKYQTVMKNQYVPYERLKDQQEKQLRVMIAFCNENVPYYRELFKSLKIEPSSIKTIDDLEKLPVLTKELIKDRPDEFKPRNLSTIKHRDLMTGGSTGVPLPYRLSTNDRFLGGALLYRGWGYGGYRLGDRMVFLAGTSLDFGGYSNLGHKFHEFSRNLRKLPPDIDENEARRYATIINSFKPQFIRGYASAIFTFAEHVKINNISIRSPKAVFTTAEKLLPHMRKKISEVFECEVFDGYGLNDGGVSAYECQEHSGLHIDMERSVLEGVDERGDRVEEGEGKILATSLHNFAFPFIRYDTGDMGHFHDECCPCGRGHRTMSNIVGREKEFLITPEGKYLHGQAILYAVLEEIGHTDQILEIQLVQQTKYDITINIVVHKNFDSTKLDRVSKGLEAFAIGWNVQINIVEDIKKTQAGKSKFVINKLLE